MYNDIFNGVFCYKVEKGNFRKFADIQTVMSTRMSRTDCDKNKRKLILLNGQTCGRDCEI